MDRTLLKVKKGYKLIHKCPHKYHGSTTTAVVSLNQVLPKDLREKVRELVPLIQRIVFKSYMASSIAILKYLDSPDEYKSPSVDQEFFMTSLMTSLTAMSKTEKLWQHTLQDMWTHKAVFPITMPENKEALVRYLLYLFSKTMHTNADLHMRNYRSFVEDYIEFTIRDIFGK